MALRWAVVTASGKADRDVAKRVANWLLSERAGVLKASNIAADHPKNTLEANTALIVAANDGLISGGKAKEIFASYLTGEIDLAAEIEANKQTSDTGAIEAAVAKVLADNADKVAEYKGGKEALFGFFVGQTMKAMQGKANPGVVNDLLRKALA